MALPLTTTAFCANVGVEIPTPTTKADATTSEATARPLTDSKEGIDTFQIEQRI
jgi:hypothetical protein